jgi:glycosyltransferase involved in cell wall biosynthesis
VTSGSASRPKLLFFVTEDYYFVSHRLTLAVTAQADGYDVGVVTRVRECGDIIRRAGLRLLPFENARSGLNPITELWTLFRLIRLYRRERPDLVHHVAMKPVLYGSIAASLAGRPAIINAVAGMGWLFISRSGWARWLARPLRAAFERVLSAGIALVQNPDDARLLVEMGVPESRIRRVPGSGVDIHVFRARPVPEGTPVVVLAARLLWDKGVGEFVAAARLLRQRGVTARFLLAGEPDALNPASIPAGDVSAWVREGVVEHLGWVADMPGLLAACHIACLPSYREGLPKSLIEAAAAGRAIVTTDVPGCRDVVRDGDNGFLVPPRDSRSLADALARLIENPELQRQMGARSRARAEQEFAMDGVVQQILALYREALV